MKPSKIQLHKKSRLLELSYPDGKSFELNAEYLRVYSPSAEVRGHHPSQAVLQSGKQHVGIDNISAVGNYAIQIHFDDGHNSGIYSWSYLRELIDDAEANWQDYLDRLARAGKTRDPDVQTVSIIDPRKPR